MNKPLIKDYCKPFSLDPTNTNLVSFDSKAYAKEAKKYIEQLESEKEELIKALNELYVQDEHDFNYCLRVQETAGKLIKKYL